MVKRTICFLLILMVMLSAAAIASAAGNGYVRGDADGDGTVTILDATAIQRKLADLSVSSFNEKAADVDGDGLNILDATRIQRKLAAFADPYHIGETVSENTRPTQDEYELPFIPSK